MTKRNLMRKLTVLSIMLFLLFLLLPRVFAVEALKLPNPAATISMDFKDADLKDILKLFSMQSGLNFVASQAVQNRTVTLYLDKVPVMACMDNLFKANNLSYEKEPGSNILIVTDWGQPQVKTLTKAFILKYNRLSNSKIEQEINNYLQSATEFSGGGSSSAGGGGGGGTTAAADEGITNSIKKILTQYGKVTEDRRANCLVVTDIPSNFSTIEATIAALDISVPMIMLEVEMLDISKSQAEQLGFKYGQTPFTAIIKGATTDLGAPYGSWSKMFNQGNGSLSINPTDSEYTVQFDFLKTLTDAKFLARPRILTLSNETAEIKIATQESVGLTTTITGDAGIVTASPERAETGVILRITPQVNMETGEITMFVMPSVAESVQGSAITGGANGSEVWTFRDPEVRSTKSVVRVRDGDTIVLGGLIRNKRQTIITKLPFFGDIPILGIFFKHKNVAPDQERELIVFITPRIIKEGEKQNLAMAGEGAAGSEVKAEAVSVAAK